MQIEQYKAEIKRLQESEAQIKALSVNYAALLKEREVPVCFLVSFIFFMKCTNSILKAVVESVLVRVLCSFGTISCAWLYTDYFCLKVYSEVLVLLVMSLFRW